MNDNASGQPDGIAGARAVDATASARACPPNRKHAAIKTTKATVLIAAVASCVRLPHRTPRHCNTKNPAITSTEISLTCPASGGNSAPLYSAITMATAAAVPQVESQSLQPTTNPAYSPSARREKLYCPPLRGIAAPNSAMEGALKNAYSPPTIHTPKNI